MLSNFAAKLIVGTLTVESYLNALYRNRTHPVKAPPMFYFVSNAWYGYLLSNAIHFLFIIN